MEEFQVTTDWLQARTAVTPEFPALIDCTESILGQGWNFLQLDNLVDRLSVALQKQGVSQGDHVAVLLPNSLAFVTCVFSLIRLGAILVPLNIRLTPVELRTQITMSNSTLCLCSSTLESVALAACGAQCATAVIPDGAHDFHEWLRGEENTLVTTRSSQLTDIQSIVFTSGTSGTPKGASLTYGNHFWSATASAFRIGVHPVDRWLACLPLFHVGGLAILFRSCLYGTPVILHKGFDSQAVLESSLRHRASLISLVPTTLSRLLHEFQLPRPIPDFRLILLGGASAPENVLHWARESGLQVATTYGLTEAASQVATALPEETRRKPGTVGRPQLFNSINIIGEDGLSQEPDHVGEVAIQGPTVMAGYYQNDIASSMAIRNNWLYTGDMGYLDDDGYLWIVDRRDDLIVTGGENVYPAEVERVLRRYPGIAEACVVGIPDAEWGKRVVAAVMLEEPATLTAEELQEYCRENLAGFKRPKIIVFVDELPSTSSGKIKRSDVASKMMREIESI
jgi:o-succinylbenzoate---CoA ligase